MSGLLLALAWVIIGAFAVLALGVALALVEVAWDAARDAARREQDS